MNTGTLTENECAYPPAGPMARGGTRGVTTFSAMLQPSRVIKAFRRGDFAVPDVHTPLACLFESSRRGPDIIKQRKPKALIPEGVGEDDKVAWLEQARGHIRAKILNIGQRLDGCLRRGDVDAFWGHWCTAVEDGYLDAHQLPANQRIGYKGHGRVQFYQTSLFKATAATARGRPQGHRKRKLRHVGREAAPEHRGSCGAAEQANWHSAVSRNDCAHMVYRAT